MEEEAKLITVKLPQADSENSPKEIDQDYYKSTIEGAKERILSNVAEGLKTGMKVTAELSPLFENFGKMILNALDAIQPLIEVAQQFSAAVVKAISALEIPTISEEQKNELIKSHQQWGRFGWTYFPDAPLGFYDECPTSSKEANRAVNCFCSEEAMLSLFESLRTQNVKKEDLESAIYCYQNKQYKACALILFGIIDSKLIRNQKSGEKRRFVGKRAVEVLRGQFERSVNEEILFMALAYITLFTCLETMFADGKDFKNEPDVINRNFVGHGMNRRPVRKRDCIQLFTALYNLMYFLENAR